MAYVIVGLGNPADEYDGTRHNAGRMVVEAFGKKSGVEEWREDKKAVALVAKVGGATLLLPDTYMNKSGTAVQKYVKSPKQAATMVIVYDDLDLPLGKMKISFARSAGGHNGVKSVERGVKTNEFIRLRIGVSPHTASGKTKKPSGEDAVLKFILGTFSPKEKDEFKKVVKRGCDALAMIVDDGYDHAMNVVNAQ